MNVDFWFCNVDFCKNPEGKKRDFCRLSMTLKGAHFCSCPNSKGDMSKALTFFVFILYPHLKDIILNVHNWQLRQCLHDWESCNVLKQCSLVRPVLAGTAISGLNLCTTSISLQWPFSSVPKVAMDEKFNCIPITNCCWPPHQYNIIMSVGSLLLGGNKCFQKTVAVCLL